VASASRSLRPECAGALAHGLQRHVERVGDHHPGMRGQLTADRWLSRDERQTPAELGGLAGELLADVSGVAIDRRGVGQVDDEAATGLGDQARAAPLELARARWGQCAADEQDGGAASQAHCRERG
jgi:hypothetical protein